MLYSAIPSGAVALGDHLGRELAGVDPELVDQQGLDLGVELGEVVAEVGRLGRVHPHQVVGVVAPTLVTRLEPLAGRERVDQRDVVGRGSAGARRPPRGPGSGDPSRPTSSFRGPRAAARRARCRSRGSGRPARRGPSRRLQAGCRSARRARRCPRACRSTGSRPGSWRPRTRPGPAARQRRPKTGSRLPSRRFLGLGLRLRLRLRLGRGLRLDCGSGVRRRFGQDRLGRLGDRLGVAPRHAGPTGPEHDQPGTQTGETGETGDDSSAVDPSADHGEPDATSVLAFGWVSRATLSSSRNCRSNSSAGPVLCFRR